MGLSRIGVEITYYDKGEQALILIVWEQGDDPFEKRYTAEEVVKRSIFQIE